MSHDGKVIACGSTNNKINLWNTENNENPILLLTTDYESIETLSIKNKYQDLKVFTEDKLRELLKDKSSSSMKTWMKNVLGTTYFEFPKEN